MKKRWFGLLAAMMLCLCVGAVSASAAEVAGGNCGENLDWSFDPATGSITVTGSRREVLSQADVPVLVVHGREDTQIPTDKCSIISHAEEITAENYPCYVTSSFLYRNNLVIYSYDNLSNQVQQYAIFSSNNSFGVL